MSKMFDHTSVGMLVWNEDKLLLIERARFPFGFAPPAGHVDGDATYEQAAARELQEEVGLAAQALKLVVEGRKDNLCRREDGTWHHWKVYQTEVSGEVQRSRDETRQAGWHGKDKLKELAIRTEAYLAKKISDEEWQLNPGLEPVWYEWLTQLEII